MSDRDYNSPEYERPNYETAEEYNRARREREAGNTMSDATGKPLKNYFALKLVLSIIMIMGCCCSNFFLVIVGIIALVFTCKANTAYNQGNPTEFRKYSKVSSVLLWMGGIVMAIMLTISIIVLAIAGQKFEDYEGLEDPETDVQYLDDRTTPLPEGYADFVWEKKIFSVPMSYDRFLEMGFELEDFSSQTEVKSGDLEFYSFKMDNGYYGSVCFSNYGEETLNVIECSIAYLYFYNDEYGTLNITFFDGLTWGCSLDDVKAFLGEPQYISTQTYEDMDVYQTVSWNYYKDGMSQGVTVSFDNDKMYSVTLEWFDK